MAISLVNLNDVITRKRAPLVSGGYGNQTYDWPNATSTDFKVKWSWETVTEVVGDEPQTVTLGKAMGGPGLDLEATDRVVYRGDTYEVYGDIRLSTDGRGNPHHVRVRFRRITTTGT
jgi:hypothetical protein